MAGRGPRTGGRRTPGAAPEAVPDTALVQVRDLAGRPRGTGFAADHHGTVVTSHEAVDGLARLVLHAPGGRTCIVGADAVTALPGTDLALVRTDDLGLDPLPVTARDRVETGAYVRIAAGGWREARVLGTTRATYAATDRFHQLDAALELAIGTAGADALRLGGGAAGGPVLDAATGAVVAVLGTALRTGHPTAGLAVPLRATGLPPVLADLLERNAATVPAYGADLNLAGVLELTATSLGSDGPAGAFGAGCASSPRGGSAHAHAEAWDDCPSTAAGAGEDAAEQAPTGFGTGSFAGVPESAERPDVIEEFAAFAAGEAAVLALVGRPGSGRTTELTALAARRTGGPEPAPTLWLRGADLLATDTSVADAATRALERAGRIVAAPETGLPDRALSFGGNDGDLGDLDPGRPARLARAAGRPLLLILDSPEEMPPELAHRLPEWTAGTAAWLRESGARLVVGCREEYWEQAGEEFPRELLHGAGAGTGGDREPLRERAPRADAGAGDVPRADGDRLPPCVRLGDLGEEAARRARARHGIPEGLLQDADARHPLTLRLLAEVRAALPVAPDTVPERPLRRDEVFAAYLDLMCLRVAVRLAAANGLRGTDVRRLVARVSGQVHEAARRCLGPGQGELDRAAFESVFPWGPAPASRLGATTGWASAVLTEGLVVPAGTGYRFAHEELADWIQGTHLDVDAALHALVHRAHAVPAGPDGDPAGPRPAGAAARRRSRTARADARRHALPVPRHRIGPVVQALLLLDGQHARTELIGRLEDLVDAVDALLPAAPEPPGDPVWWATHLLRDVLTRVPDASPYSGVLRQLAERIVAWRAQGRRVPGEFGPWFWEAVRLPGAERFELLRRLVVADEAPHPADPGRGTPAQQPWRADGGTADDPADGTAVPGEPGGPEAARPRTPRFLDTVARLLAADPTAVLPHLTRWFDDERPLPATPDATVATAAQALLYAHRRRALDDLTEALVACAHRRGDELLAVLAEEEPSAMCRAVDRWAHDERPARHVAAMTYGLRTAPHARTEADLELLRFAALSLLARPADGAAHGAALALLVGDPRTRARHLPQALERFTAGDPQLPASALVAALDTHPEPVLDAFEARLRRPGPDAGELLRPLTDAATPALAHRVAALVRRVAEVCPDAAGHVADRVDRRLEHGPDARAVLLPLLTGLLDGGPPALRARLVSVLVAPGSPRSRPLRHELLELLLAGERDLTVLDALLRAAAAGAARSDEEHARELVRRAGLLLVRTPDGATLFDCGLVDLARGVPGFAALVAGWLTDAPQDWSAVVGPSARRMIENLAGVRVPA
ncbi:trypsin-like peptidase domain-containing protein [Streptomyces sp. NPDC004082]